MGTVRSKHIPHSHMYIQGFNQGIILYYTVLVDKKTSPLACSRLSKKSQRVYAVSRLGKEKACEINTKIEIQGSFAIFEASPLFASRATSSH